jgi:GNAT superfamily N-acetyltransferase
VSHLGIQSAILSHESVTKMPSITLNHRFATVEDIPILLPLINQAYRGHHGQAGWSSEGHLLDGARAEQQELIDTITSPGSYALLGLVDRTIIASMRTEVFDDHAYFSMLAVNPLWQSQGIGRKMFAEIERWCHEEHNIHRFTINVLVQRQDLIDFYQRMGYRDTGKRTPIELIHSPSKPKVEGLIVQGMEKQI